MYVWVDGFGLVLMGFVEYVVCVGGVVLGELGCGDECLVECIVFYYGGVYVVGDGIFFGGCYVFEV